MEIKLELDENYNHQKISLKLAIQIYKKEKKDKLVHERVEFPDRWNKVYVLRTFSREY